MNKPSWTGTIYTVNSKLEIVSRQLPPQPTRRLAFAQLWRVLSDHAQTKNQTPEKYRINRVGRGYNVVLG